jgi:hypothetical protein
MGLLCWCWLARHRLSIHCNNINRRSIPEGRWRVRLRLGFLLLPQSLTMFRFVMVVAKQWMVGIISMAISLRYRVLQVAPKAAQACAQPFPITPSPKHEYPLVIEKPYNSLKLYLNGDSWLSGVPAFVEHGHRDLNHRRMCREPCVHGLQGRVSSPEAEIHLLRATIANLTVPTCTPLLLLPSSCRHSYRNGRIPPLCGLRILPNNTIVR